MLKPILLPKNRLKKFIINEANDKENIIIL